MYKRAIESSLAEWDVVKLVKFYNKREYADRLLRKGELYMRPIRGFAFKSNDGFGDGRRDPCEAQASRIMVESPGKPIFCCTSIGTSGLNDFFFSPEGKRVAAEMMGAEGSAVVIDDPVEFLARVYKAEPGGFRYGRVAYMGDMLGVKDAMLHPGLAAFIKNQRYAYQHEFRIALNADQPLKLERVGEFDGIPVLRQRFDPKTVTAGPLEDIACMMTADQLASLDD